MNPTSLWLGTGALTKPYIGSDSHRGAVSPGGLFIVIRGAKGNVGKAKNQIIQAFLRQGARSCQLHSVPSASEVPNFPCSSGMFVDFLSFCYCKSDAHVPLHKDFALAWNAREGQGLGQPPAPPHWSQRLQ